MTTINFDAEVNSALLVVGACVLCWFTGYAAGYVVRTIRRLLGNAAR